MDRTTIYIDNELRRRLFEAAYEESKRTGKRVGIAQIIRKAIRGYLKIGSDSSAFSKKAIMLATKGKLDERFAAKVKDAQRLFRKWKT